MDEKIFNKIARPYLIEISIGDPLKARGIGFDRLDLDAWWEQHKARNGRSRGKGKIILWDANQLPDSTSEESSGISAKPFTESKYANLPGKKTLIEPKSISEKKWKRPKPQEYTGSDRKERLMTLYEST